MITVIETHKPAPAVILKDSYGRAIRDLRVSLTDRCNFRCFYCLPHGEPPIAPKEQMLSYEEIEYVCDIFVELGIEKIRLTGGEPMMRRDIETIIRKLAKLKQPVSDKLQFVDESRDPNLGSLNDKLKFAGHRGLRDLALTTNGYFLPDRAESLKAAGLDRITISLDSLKRNVFKQMTGVDVLDRVLEGIEAARHAGLQPIKINAVIVRGHNDDEVADFAAFARERDVKMRFIEFMPLDSGHEWSRDDVISGREIRERIDLVGVITRHGVELKKSGRSFKGCCPFHQEKTPSFHVWPRALASRPYPQTRDIEPARLLRGDPSKASPRRRGTQDPRPEKISRSSAPRT